MKTNKQVGNMFRAWTLRELVKEAQKTIDKWEAMDEETKASGMFIDPDEPVVLCVPNPECDTDSIELLDTEDDDGNDRHLYFHVLSCGGGGDTDEDGNEIGHDGFAIDGMAIQANQSYA